MHFDPYLSPPLPSSPPSASPTPPPVSTTIDYKTLAAQKDRVNDSLRLKNANLERALAEVKKADSRQKSLLPPHSSLPPPSPSRPPRRAGEAERRERRRQSLDEEDAKLVASGSCGHYGWQGEEG
ncbi:uncharacterized protein MYCGRDRAFT_96494 [Zymoseptoria tritici IPO323]|uniref:Uncharacterized protein n=1 Tax=Zymoseptoria tritici (strain CBS 115943 / IPO323) TaxID=336722 RepID=F9XMK4_ZYMTI|nr:uncharacterized protein MYCGRDRAFT_96494 [Zymoseptoria tritici IPO323]EGP83265.1 hypothetical protein MYCGRDRAFT_96494 [Zymoseptoria tritici IPO323]